MSCEMRNGFRRGSFVGNQSKRAIGRKLARKSFTEVQIFQSARGTEILGGSFLTSRASYIKDARRRDAVFTNRAPHKNNYKAVLQS